MDQLICTSLYHTHYWYELGMLKYRRVHQADTFQTNGSSTARGGEGEGRGGVVREKLRRFVL